jgi:hypothetical protein
MFLYEIIGIALISIILFSVILAMGYYCYKFIKWLFSYSGGKDAGYENNFM